MRIPACAEPLSYVSYAGHRRRTPALLCLPMVLMILVGCGSGKPGTSLAAAAQPSASAPSSASPAPAGSTTAPGPAPSTPAPAVPASTHVFFVIEENHSFSEVMAQMPWLVSLAQANGYAANYISNDGGSALDYFWLSSGSNEFQFGCDGWGCPMPITSDSIYRELDKLGMNWKLYAQSLPYAGYVKQSDVGAYAVRHNPAIWYSDIISGSIGYQQQHVVPDTQLATDLANNTLPAFSFIIPDVNNDAHNGTLAQADTYLQTTLTPLLNSAAFQPGGDGLLFVTFDECGDGTNVGCDGRVLTAVIGPNVVSHTVSNTLYHHQDALRTVLDALRVKVYPGASATAQDMADFFAH